MMTIDERFYLGTSNPRDRDQRHILGFAAGGDCGESGAGVLSGQIVCSMPLPLPLPLRLDSMLRSLASPRPCRVLQRSAHISSYCPRTHKSNSRTSYSSVSSSKSVNSALR